MKKCKISTNASAVSSRPNVWSVLIFNFTVCIVRLKEKAPTGDRGDFFSFVYVRGINTVSVPIPIPGITNCVARLCCTYEHNGIQSRRYRFRLSFFERWRRQVAHTDKDSQPTAVLPHACQRNIQEHASNKNTPPAGFPLPENPSPLAPSLRAGPENLV